MTSRLVGKEVGHSHPQRPGQLDQVQRGAVPHATFDAAHVAAADSGDVRKSLLGDVLLFSEMTDASAESLEGGVFGALASLPRHGRDARPSRRFGPRPIGHKGDCQPIDIGV